MSKEVGGMVQSRRVQGAGSARTEGARRASGVGADGAAAVVDAAAMGLVLRFELLRFLRPDQRRRPETSPLGNDGGEHIT